MIKFNGDYEKLEALGYKFHKLFAKEYPVYEKDGVWIWVDANVEFADMYGLSHLLLTAIKTNEQVLSEFGMTVYNKENNTLEPRSRKHEHVAVYAAKKGISIHEVYIIMNSNGEKSEEYFADYAAYFRETKFYSIEEKTITAIQELINLGYI